MRALVIADLHSNLPAFEAVIRDAKSRGWIDSIWCLGDIVGYGPWPRECIALLRDYPYLAVAGNHDLASAGQLDLEEFNSIAAKAAAWTEGALGEAEKRWLAYLPRTVEESGFTLTHGSLVDPVWDYLMSEETATAHLALQKTGFGFVGHTHLPLAFLQSEGKIEKRQVADASSLELAGVKFVANPGSVGQPRDGDPRAAYGLVDTARRTLEFHRVEYDIAETQAKMRRVGLPTYLIERLSRGR